MSVDDAPFYNLTFTNVGRKESFKHLKNSLSKINNVGSSFKLKLTQEVFLKLKRFIFVIRMTTLMTDFNTVVRLIQRLAPMSQVKVTRQQFCMIKTDLLLVLQKHC